MWIPGCSTGEEAYSFAIALQEFLEETGTGDVQVQIFGTDVNEKNVDKARQGIYTKKIEANVSENRLKRFFTSFNGNYQIAKFIRDVCIFAKQDLTADPPFSNLSLISCRNMLIYFDSQLQERIVSILHYALKPNGFLVLGESESIGKSTTLFEPVNKKGFIYTKKKAQSRVNFGFASTVPYAGKKVLKASGKKDSISFIRDEVDRLLITEYVPATLLVNSNLDILVFRGNVTPYLSPESGQASLNVAKMIRKELRPEVQSAVYRAKKENKSIKEEAIRFQYGDQSKTINIQVMPLSAKQYEEPFFLVLFEDVSSAATHLRQTIELSATPEGRENVKNSQIRELKEELESSKQYLQTVIETQEATNEELRSAMEEVQSSNEELQSTNEELETAKEELQSSNEELTTLNDELKNRNQALARLNDNITNLTRNVDPAVVMVDCNLKIRLFTPSAQKILNLVTADTGLPISNVRLAISVPDLEKTISEVITTLSAVNKEVSDENGRSYEMRVRPYITEDNKIDGAVLSFIDVNELKQHENKLQIEETKYRTLAENSPDIIARFDKNLRFLYVNLAIEKLTGIPSRNFVGKTDHEMGLPQNLAEAWTNNLQNTIKTGKVEKGEIEVPSPTGKRIYQFVIVPEFSVAGTIETVLSISKDVTEAEKAKEALRKSEYEYGSLFSNMMDGFAYCQMIFDEKGKPVDFVYLQVNDAFERITGLKRNLIIGKKVTQAIPGIKETNPELFEIYGRVALTGQKEKLEYFLKPLSLWLKVSVYCPSKGYFAAVLEDISERKKAEYWLHESEVKFRTVADFAYNWEYWIAPDGNLIYVSPSCKRITGYDANEFIKDPKLLTRIVHPEDKSITGSHFDLISSEELHAVDFRIVTRDGATRWISHSCKAVFDDNGKWIGCRASNRDITERKKMEQELSNSLEESQLRESEISALLKASKVVLQNKEFQDSARAIFNTCKELIGATAGYVALLSKDGKENEVLFLDAGGLPCTVDPSLPMPIRGLRAEAYNSGEATVENDFNESEWKKFMPEGHVQLKNVLFAPLMIEQRVVGVIGLANKTGGFTERDREMAMAFGEIASVALVNSRMLEMLEENEKELKAHSEHLEALVEERTKKLRDSERMAAIGETAGMVGHDIRNPLQSITGELYLARTNLADLPDTHTKEDLKESIGYIEEQLTYVNKIVQDLQDYAKTPKPQLQETDLEKAVQDVLSTVNIPENITVSSAIEAGFPKICTDPLYLKRVLTNLTSNAVQAMPKGGKIAITATCKDKKIFITVADTGEGIPNDIKDKLFKPLFTTKAKGQGFGLAVVKKLTEALNGKVTVESQLGKGTRFTVELPMTQN
jgi:PAS domain S-box-containing protein